MKVPPTAPPSEPNGERDKTITRRTVKGAAGGMKGVDYEDDRRPDEGEAPTIAASSRAHALVREARAREQEVLRGPDQLERGRPPVGRDLDQLVLEDDEPAAEEARKKRMRSSAGRDRLSIDKDAPELLRKRRWASEEDEEEEEEEEVDLDAFAELADGPVPHERRARLFSDERSPEPGDPSLTDPDEIQRALGTPVAFAKHGMILAEAFRRVTGATREEAIDYLARLFVSTSDRAFGRLAFRELGPATGILDVYPLEIAVHLLTEYPAFLPKVGLGRLFVNVPEDTSGAYHTDPKTPLLLEYPETLKIRGFALVGGGRPGYTFEPDLTPGRYRLQIQTPGHYTILVSGMDEHGYTVIDRLTVRVRAKTIDDLELPAEGVRYPERSPEKIAAWPIPPPTAPSAELPEEDAEILRLAVAAALGDDDLVDGAAVDDWPPPEDSGGPGPVADEATLTEHPAIVLEELEDD